jgi:hypothetical protein
MKNTAWLQRAIPVVQYKCITWQPSETEISNQSSADRSLVQKIYVRLCSPQQRKPSGPDEVKPQLSGNEF